jgi:exodeoxyribonuclease III
MPALNPSSEVPTKADIYNEWLWWLDAVVQPEIRAAFRRLLDQGWIDATRHLHPEESIYTFWVNDAAFRRNAIGVDSAHRGGEKPSDHAPVWMEL